MKPTDPFQQALQYHHAGQLVEARAAYERCLALSPSPLSYPHALTNLGNLYQDMGQIGQALETLDAAIRLQPDRPEPRSNRLMALQYHTEASAAELRQQAQAWGEWATQRAIKLLGLTPQRRFPQKTTGTPLRIGYVSADLAMHPVGLFLQDIVASHDANLVTPVIYSNGHTRDHVTARLIESVQAKGGGFRAVTALDDLSLARQIEADQIDILIDLSGHTGKSRLACFALRPAPVQISWLGYFATTGLPAIDFVLLDPYHAPTGTTAQFTERIIHLPHNRFCYTPVPFAPAVSPAPTFRNGTITFGSFNNTAKLGDAVLATWAAILRQVPDSRLILKWRSFADATYAEHTRQCFIGHGIAPERLDLRPASVHRELLEQYADIDIALDPFPFSGGHTSCEALWMGVPIITWPQERLVSRQTYSFLANIGLTELAASDEEKYIALAVELASQRERLTELRAGLRERLRSSPLCDVAGFTRALESACQQAWQIVRQETAHAWASQGIAARNNQAPVTTRIAYYREAVRLAPEIGMYAANLASALAEAGAYTEAEAFARQAIASSPERFEPWFNLGTALAGQGRESEAAAAYTRAAEIEQSLRPAEISPHPEQTAVGIWQAAGDAWSRGRHSLEAAQCYQQALRVHGATPSTQRAHLLGAFGEKLALLYKHAEAEAAFREALDILPDDPGQLTNLGNALTAQRRYDEARHCYERVLVLRPEQAGAYSNLGTVWQSLGDNDRAIDCYRKALEKDPAIVPIWNNLAAAMTYSLIQSPMDLRQALEGFDRRVATPLRDPRPHTNDRDPRRRLKIGYVSPDFRKHAVAYFALPLIEGHHKEQVEVFCYHNHLQNDEWTARFKACADHWRVAVAMSDAQLAAQVRADGIDILVDLAGHTENNRLLSFAMKPAPVQVTWMGYVTTTGMTAMDWRITHADADPPGSEAHYSEKLCRLPGTMWCYRPLPGMPAVPPAPIFTKGYITFGSFNRYSKNSTMVLEAWAQILTRVPASRLVICVPEGEIRQRMASFFNARGIAPERIAAFAKLSHEDFWKLHGEVDIALDPFPFGGGTTTCESLWLGVPVVTLTGREGGDFAPRFASRMGFAFLNNIGHPELACATVTDYIDTAVALANDRERLAELRQTLRPAMTSAPLTDEKRFVTEMEAAYRSMWQDGCHPNSP